MRLVSQGTLILVAGLPGAGKTTFAKQLEHERSALRFCPDDWIEAIVADPLDHVERDRLRDPVENLQWSLAKMWLQRGLTIILENGFWGRDERFQYAMEALELGCRIELFALESPDQEGLWKRVEQRNSSISDLWRMTRADLESAWSMHQPPTIEEIAFYDAGAMIPWQP